jgi:hypothetical protein
MCSALWNYNRNVERNLIVIKNDFGVNGFVINGKKAKEFLEQVWLRNLKDDVTIDLTKFHDVECVPKMGIRILVFHHGDYGGASRGCGMQN